MENLKNDIGFEKAEVARKLFNRCSLDELLTILQMHSKGIIRTMTLHNEISEQPKARINPNEQGAFLIRNYEDRLKRELNI